LLYLKINTTSIDLEIECATGINITSAAGITITSSTGISLAGNTQIAGDLVSTSDGSDDLGDTTHTWGTGFIETLANPNDGTYTPTLSDGSNSLKFRWDSSVNKLKVMVDVTEFIIAFE